MHVTIEGTAPLYTCRLATVCPTRPFASLCDPDPKECFLCQDAHKIRCIVTAKMPYLSKLLGFALCQLLCDIWLTSNLF